MTVIQHKRSSTSGAVPSSLADGEIAINEADSILFYKDNGVITAKYLAEHRRLITRGSVASVATLTLDLTPANIGIFSSFDIYLSEFRPATDQANLIMRFGDAAGIKSGSSSYRLSYLSQNTGTADGTLSGAGYGSSATSLGLGDGQTNATDRQGLCWVSLSTNDPAYDYETTMTYLMAMSDGSNIHSIFGSGYYSAAILDLTQVQFLFDTGNIAQMKYALVGVP